MQFLLPLLIVLQTFQLIILRLLLLPAQLRSWPILLHKRFFVLRLIVRQTFQLKFSPALLRQQFLLPLLIVLQTFQLKFVPLLQFVLVQLQMPLFFTLPIIFQILIEQMLLLRLKFLPILLHNVYVLLQQFSAVPFQKQF